MGAGTRHVDIPFGTLRDPLKALLIDFGPYRKTLHPEFPFWYLKNDGVWQLTGAEDLTYRKGKPQPTARELEDRQVLGGFTPEVYDALEADPDLAFEIAGDLLHAHFPESVHEDLLAVVGLDRPAGTATRRVRDPHFKDQVLAAYEYRCAVCDTAIWLGRVVVGLEAAHIKWHSAGGPDQANNGLALCAMHHKLFDRGAFTFGSDRRIAVSELVHGSETDWLDHDRALRQPCTRH